MSTRLYEKYKKEVAPSMQKTFAYKSTMQTPKLEKIVINVGLGRAVSEPKLVENVVKEVAVFTGQKPIVTKAKKAISNFKLREGMPIGCKVTLRKDRMYEFLDRLCSIALPRVRDFRGVSNKGFDKSGNYTLGIKDYAIFPEIKLENVQSTFGMNISFVSTSKNPKEGKELLTQLGMPFRK